MGLHCDAEDYDFAPKGTEAWLHIPRFCTACAFAERVRFLSLCKYCCSTTPKRASSTHAAPLLICQTPARDPYRIRMQSNKLQTRIPSIIKLFGHAESHGDKTKQNNPEPTIPPTNGHINQTAKNRNPYLYLPIDMQHSTYHWMLREVVRCCASRLANYTSEFMARLTKLEL